MQKRTNTIKTIKFDKGLYKGELKNNIPNGFVCLKRVFFINCSNFQIFRSDKDPK